MILLILRTNPKKVFTSMNNVLSVGLVLVAFLTTIAVHADDQTSLVEPGAKVTKLASGMKFTEGPVWLPKEKKLVFSDIPNSKLMQWSEADGLSVFRPSEQANGNILDLEGRIVSCQHLARNVVRTEPDGTITVLADKCDGRRFNSPNDVAIRSDGTLWFTDPPWGLNGSREIPGNWIFKLDPATGKVEAVVKDLAMPNGIVFSPDEDRLYISDTGGREMHPDPAFHKLPAAVHCYEVSRDGQLGKKLFVMEGGSDGMTVDADGNLYTTHEKVNIFGADGKPLEQIDIPESPANVCFGGDDFKTLFITAQNSLYSVRMKHPGAKLRGAK
jgi:gluconolactonase